MLSTFLAPLANGEVHEIDGEARITFSSSPKANVVIHNDTVVWWDYRSWSWEQYLISLTSGMEKQIGHAISPTWFDMWENIMIVGNSSTSNIDVINIESGIKSIIPINATPTVDRPSIYVDKVVTSECYLNATNNTQQDIFLYNLTSGERSQLSNSSIPEFDPRIWGDYIVWVDGLNGIRLYYLSNDTSVIISPDYASRPAIHGNHIVWKMADDLWLYNITSKETIQLTNDAYNQYHPAIWGNYIAWVDDRDGSFDIYLYDIYQQLEFRLTKDDGDQGNDNYGPDIYDEKIVWIDYRDDRDGISTNNERNEPEIYLIDLARNFDDDGIPDFFDSDDDNDGFNDTFELEKGTDPFDALSYPKGVTPSNDFGAKYGGYAIIGGAALVGAVGVAMLLARKRK